MTVPLPGARKTRTPAAQRAAGVIANSRTVASRGCWTRRAGLRQALRHAVSDDRLWWGTAIEAPDPGALARFYAELLGWRIGHDEPGTTILTAPEGPIYVVFQQAADYQPPVWPPVDGEQRP